MFALISISQTKFQRMSGKEEGDSESAMPCSVMLTDEKIYVCHDEQDNSLIRQLDSIKLDYVTKLLVDPQYQYYCVIVRKRLRK